MKIGTRITLLVSTVVLVVLPLFGTLSLRGRRAEVRAALEEKAALAGTSLQVSLEAALAAFQDGFYEDTGGLVARFQEAQPSFRLTFLDLRPDHAGQPSTTFTPPPPDPQRAERLAQLGVLGRAVGIHTTLDGRPAYVLTLPVRDPDKRVVGAVELVADEHEVGEAVSASFLFALGSLGALGVGLAVVVWLSSRAALRPLRRLVEAIDDVAKGDLGRVILGGNDEVGELAERFNQMTASLREAQGEIVEGVEAKLALEARLRHSEKLATIGQLAAGIAHEVGTPLNVIGGRARTMEKRAAEALKPREPGDDEPPSLNPADMAKNAAIIAEQTQRIARIIQQLLDFARRPEAVRRTLDLAEVARGTLDFLEYSFATQRVEVRMEPHQAPDAIEGGPPAPSDARVEGDPDQLQQVCINLCLNALQAMPDGGRLTVRTRGVVRRRPGLEAAPAQGFVVLEVEDTGVGIPESERERIFEPFYSTKGESGGTGLGLAVSVGIVKDHEGWIDIESPPAGASGGATGTLFRLFLPGAPRE